MSAQHVGLDGPGAPGTLAQAFESCWSRPRLRGLPALGDGELELDYAQLDARTAGLGARLRALAPSPGQVVAIAMERSLRAALLLLGALRAGLCPCVMEPGLAAAEVSRRLRLIGAVAIVHDRAHGDLVAALEPSPARVVDFGDLECLRPVARSVDGLLGSTPALLLFTSGSTGQPKAVQLSQGALLNNAVGVAGHCGLDERDRLLHVMPLYHTNGLNNQLFAPLLAGSSVVLAPRFRAEHMPALLERHRPSILTGVPTMFSRMQGQTFSATALAGLRFARCGSAPITEALHRAVEDQLGCPLLISYGLSEATCTSTMNPPRGRRIGSVGTVLAGQQVRLRLSDASLSDDPGVEGEICIAGANLMSGYVGAADETSRSVVDGWLRTGDLGRFDADGYLYVTGRIKDVIIRGGENLSPLLIEGVIMERIAAQACCVVARADQDLGEVPVAVIVPRPGARFGAEQVMEAVREGLSRIYVPREVILADSLPENSVGKVDRKELTRRVRDGTAGRAASAA